MILCEVVFAAWLEEEIPCYSTVLLRVMRGTTRTQRQNRKEYLIVTHTQQGGFL